MAEAEATRKSVVSAVVMAIPLQKKRADQPEANRLLGNATRYNVHWIANETNPRRVGPGISGGQTRRHRSLLLPVDL
jgi:hypothetical protein